MTEDLVGQGASHDPAVGLRAVAALRRLSDQLERLQVDNARAQGWSYADIAAELGVSKQAVHKKHAGRIAPGTDREVVMFERFSESARAVVVGAQEEAQALGADQILAEHLLLAMLASSEPGATVLWNHGLRRDALIDQLRRLGTGDEDALRSIGVDLEAVRASVEASFGPGALDRTPATPTRRRFRRWSGDSLRFSAPAIRALEGSLRITIELEQNAIGADHVLAALLDDGEPAARTLGRLGIDPVAVRTEVMVGLRS